MGFTATKDTTGVMVVGVDGQLIVGNRQELKQLVQEAVDHGEKKFLVEFSKAGYIDSSGLGALVSISKKVREQGGELRKRLRRDRRKFFEIRQQRMSRRARERERHLEFVGVKLCLAPARVNVVGAKRRERQQHEGENAEQDAAGSGTASRSDGAENGSATQNRMHTFHFSPK